jgi:hypothetical protein
MADLIYNACSLRTLRYFQRGYERDPAQFWVAEQRTPVGRLSRLISTGLIERAAAPNTDLYRVTPAGLSALDIAP